MPLSLPKSKIQSAPMTLLRKCVAQLLAARKVKTCSSRPSCLLTKNSFQMKVKILMICLFKVRYKIFAALINHRGEKRERLFLVYRDVTRNLFLKVPCQILKSP